MLLKIMGGSLEKANDGSAGFEIKSAVDIDILPGQQVKISTGIYTEFDKEFVAICKEKSGNSLKKQLRVHAGVIDSNYRGEWGIIVSNGSTELIEIKKGQAIAQVIFVRLEDVVIQSVSELNSSDRGAGGYGSTGLGIG